MQIFTFDHNRKTVLSCVEIFTFDLNRKTVLSCVQIWFFSIAALFSLSPFDNVLYRVKMVSKALMVLEVALVRQEIAANLVEMEQLG